jgi:hypothetical protein
MDMEARTTGLQAEEQCRKGHKGALGTFVVCSVKYYTCGEGEGS